MQNNSIGIDMAILIGDLKNSTLKSKRFFLQ